MTTKKREKTDPLNRIIDVPPEGIPAPGSIPAVHRDYPLSERISRVLIPEQVIQNRVSELARQIAGNYSRSRSLALITILKGACIFASDLGREINRYGGHEIQLDFYEAQTYGTGIKGNNRQTREVRILRRPLIRKDTDILLVDDIGDTVQTITHIREDLVKNLNIDPARIKICFLLEKILKNPSPEIRRRKQALKAEYIGFRIPDVWIAGYGIDAGEDFRLLPSIVSIREEYYKSD